MDATGPAIVPDSGRLESSPIIPPSTSIKDPAMGPRIVPDVQKEENLSGEVGGDFRPNRWDAYVNTLKQVSHGSPVGIPGTGEPGFISRFVNEYNTEQVDQHYGVPKISPEEANSKFPGMPTPFNEPVDPKVAEIRFNNFKHMQRIQDELNRGTQLTWVEKFGLGAGGGFADPSMLLAMGLTGGAAGLMGVGKSFAGILGQNLAINAATGVGSYLQESREQTAPSVGDKVQEAIYGALGGTAFHYGAGYLFRFAKKAVKDFLNTPDNIKTDNLKRAVGQSEAGVPIDNSMGAAATEASRQGKIISGDKPFPAVAPEHPSQAPYFMGHGSDGTPVQFDSLGPGHQATTDGAKMNNFAEKLSMIKVPEDSKFLKIDEPVNSEGEISDNQKTAQSIISEFQEKTGVDLELKPGESMKDAFDKIQEMQYNGEAPENSLELMQQIAKERGLSGYEYAGQDSKGQVTDHRIHLFDNPDVVDQYQSNPDIRPNLISAAEKQAITEKQLSPDNAKIATPELDQKIHELRHQESLNATPEYQDSILPEQMEELKKELEYLAKNIPDAKEGQDILRRSEANDAQELGLVEELANCITGGIS